MATDLVLPTVHETEVDGVRTLWSPAPGPLAAALTVRTGRVDETLATGGMAHLVEHLAMERLGRPRHDHNAFVDSVRTVFFAVGTEAEVVAFLGTITDALATIPTDRLDHEREVLRRESDGRTATIFEAHRTFRYGLGGHALVAQPEHGLGSITAEALAAWAAPRYGRANAMLWLTGPPPAGLRLGLADGSRRPIPPPTVAAEVQLPAHLQDAPGVGLGMQLTRRRGSGSFPAILEDRLRRRLRHERGLVYTVLGDYEPLDASQALALVGGDCAPAAVEEVTDLVLEELDALARGEGLDDDLRGQLEDLERVLGDPTAVAGVLDTAVRDALLGMAERSPAEQLEEQRATTADDVVAAASEGRATAILLAGTDAIRPGFHAWPMTSQRAVTGREVKPVLSFFGIGFSPRLIVGDEGVTIRLKDGRLATVRYADCVLAEVPGGELLVLWDRDGSRVAVPASFWRGGDALHREILARVPPEVIVRELRSQDLAD